MSNIAVAGIGYVGLSAAVLLAQQHTVTAVDPIPEKVALVNRRCSPIEDRELRERLETQPLRLTATTHAKRAYREADFVIVAVPTDFDEQSGRFDTSAVRSVIRRVREVNDRAVIVIRSTVPIGFTQSLGDRRVLFCPEFLREGKALYDNLHPSRIVIGICDPSAAEAAQTFGTMLVRAAEEDTVALRILTASEAEAVKLFSNAYLAMRIGFFNELDTFAEANRLNSRRLIEGVGLDPRIGTDYNNPSFGYGGYCLPKDTRQLLAHYGSLPQTLISAIVSCNDARKTFLVNQILKRRPRTVGIYRLTMKADSDNFRRSSSLELAKRLHSRGIPVLIYEPLFREPSCFGAAVIRDPQAFKRRSDLILANRTDPFLADVAEKVYSRDLFHIN